MTSERGGDSVPLTAKYEASLRAMFEMLAPHAAVIAELSDAWIDPYKRAGVMARHGEDRIDALVGGCVAYAAALLGLDLTRRYERQTAREQQVEDARRLEAEREGPGGSAGPGGQRD